ncbi:MAG TPA: class II glutamine amidotransferase, partial [Sporichthya sp.]|nr:class II glutamine amidotransferase [Sporichthya sp.]
MCRLVGWVSTTPITVAEALGEPGLAELTELSRLHADGWGIAWWEGERLRSLTGQIPAHSSPEFAAAVRTIRADAVLLHLRWATPGIPVGAENTHPFLVEDRWAFGHNGAVRPADGLLPFLTVGQRAALNGDTDSERLLHLLLDRVRKHGLDEGLRQTVADVSRDLTPSSLNALLLGREDLTALCCHYVTPEGKAPPPSPAPENQPGYFDLCWTRLTDAVVIASEPLGQWQWERIPNGTALVLSRNDAAPRTVDVGTFPPAALAREHSRREVAAAPRGTRPTSGTAQIRVGCDFVFNVPAPVAAVFQVEPQDEPRQRILAGSLSFLPAGEHTTYQDSFGNRCSRLSVGPGPFSLHYDAIVEVPRILDDTDVYAPEDPVQDLPSEVLLYLMSSRFCLSDVLAEEALDRFGGLAPGWRRVQAIVDAVNSHLTFGYGDSSPTYTAADAFAEGKGVCRDFAHLAISFCRALNIPARYVFGYVPDFDLAEDPPPMDFAAWMEVWLGGRWWTFDPRNNAHRAGRIVIGRGRDAVDVAMVTTYGAAEL